MSAKINGTEWKSVARNTTLKDNKFIITGAALDGKTIIISVFGTSVGEYNNVTKFLAVYKETLSTSTEDAYTALTGKVTISDINTTKKEISGTFNFEMVKLDLSTVSVTEGKFSNLNYIEVPE
jgi:hypothetical protein